MSEQTPAGWYDQPDGSKRYWDGSSWTDAVSASAAPPAKKGMSAGKIIGITIGALVLLCGGGGILMLILGGSAVNEAAQEIEAAQSAAAESGVSSGLGSQDASGDVSIGQATTEFGLTSLPMTATNNSEKRSNYWIEVNAESGDGATVYDSSWTYINNVEPGQTGVGELQFYTELPPDTTFRLVKVERTAAS